MLPGTKRRLRATLAFRAIVVVCVCVPLALIVYHWATYPSDKTPAGAYLRVARAVNQGKPAEFFAYTEEAAQHACYSVRDFRRQSLELVERHFPAQEQQKLREEYARFAAAPDGADVFALLVQEYGWLHQLRQDMSGISKVDVAGPRATVQTVKGTRYAFRRRPGGIWGLTAFTPALVEEAEKAARDYKQVEKAAADYDRALSTAP